MFAFIIASVVFLIFAVKWIKMIRNTPPGPWGLPLLGYYPFLGKNPFVTLQKLSEKHGDIMVVNLLNKNYYFLNSLELVNEALVAKGDNFAGKPIDEFNMFTHIEGDQCIANIEGKFWEVLHKFFLSTLAGAGMGKSEFENRIHDACELTLKNIHREAGKPFDSYRYLSNFTSNVISSIAFSKLYEYNDPEYVQFQQISYSLFRALEYLDGVLTGNIFYVLKRIERRAYDLGRKAGHEIFEFMSNSLKKIIKERKDEQYNDVLHFFLKEVKAQNSEYFTHEIMITNIYELFIAGTHATAMTLYFGINFMARHKSIQIKVQEEIDEVLGKDRLVSTQDRNLLPYTSAVLAEIQRYSCVPSIGSVHVNKGSKLETLRKTNQKYLLPEEDKIGNYTIPKRSNIIANIWKLSRDQRFFKNTEQFDPENFLDENGRFVNVEANIPFAVGRRKCLGAKLAEVELFICFVTLMQKFEWNFPEKQCPKLEIIEGTLRTCLPYKICATER